MRCLGTIQPTLSNLELMILKFANNLLTGTIPSELFETLPIKVLNLSSNFLEGTLPESLTQLSMLQSLDVSYNMLQGNLTYKVHNAEPLSIFFVQGNSFHGNVEGLFDLSFQNQIVNVDLSDNLFSGKIFYYLS